MSYEDIRRHRADAVAQGLWGVENGTLEPRDIGGHFLGRARRPGSYDPYFRKWDPDKELRQATTPRPMGYHIHIPAEPRICFSKEMRVITVAQVVMLHAALEREGLLGAWQTYIEGGCFKIFSYWPSRGTVEANRLAREQPLLQRAALLLGDIVCPTRLRSEAVE